ncbi:hypothetical protein PVAP13_9NG511746 [Panicum virgatum]|uniref:Uncharacterized protein n=1 Tax=Panicum virgatum TaxID=38727 RepID=A0A8T0MJP8_PANVG|nr:hypothetical protein PVAP13_9NG511746 [Panicum virgatum]
MAPAPSGHLPPNKKLEAAASASPPPPSYFFAIRAARRSLGVGRAAPLLPSPLAAPLLALRRVSPAPPRCATARRSGPQRPGGGPGSVEQRRELQQGEAPVAVKIGAKEEVAAARAGITAVGEKNN